jgi:hypothetical protein
MCLPRALAVAAALAAVSAALTGNAQPASGPVPGSDARSWVLMLSAVTDENDYQHALASYQLGFSDTTWLSVAAGSSRAPSSETDVRADLYLAGVEHDFGPVGLGLTVQQWGDPDNLESSDWEGEIFFSDDRYRVALSYEQRRIDIYFSGAGAPIASDLRRVGIDADGFGVDGRLRLSPGWQIYGSWTSYDYPRGIRLVPRADRLDLLSTSAVTLAYSFIDQYATFGLERAFGLRLFNVDLSQDRSTLDGEKFRSISASMLWPVARRMDLEFQLGRSRSDTAGSSVYGGLSLMIYGH